LDREYDVAVVGAGLAGLTAGGAPEDPHPDLDALAAGYVRLAEAVVPGLSDHIVYALGADHGPDGPLNLPLHRLGPIYGWSISPGNSGPFRLPQVTPVDGLYLAGHWTQPGHGIWTVVASGVQVTRHVLGRSTSGACSRSVCDARPARPWFPRGSDPVVSVQSLPRVPRPPMTDDAYTRARFDAAERLRKLGHAMVAHRPPPETLERIVSIVDEVLPEIEEAPTRVDPLSFLAEPDVQQAIAAGDLPFLLARATKTALFEDSIVSGPANPMSIAATYSHDGGEAIARVVLGPAFEGAPGRAHGGVLAALFDETMGAVLPATGTLAYTGSLTIDYLRPTPIGEELEVRARIAGREGRKITVEATGTVAEGTFARASGVFIAVADLRQATGDPQAPPATDG
jgi:acyl-coenzyme A thioesterase PaaI-like protein